MAYTKTVWVADDGKEFDSDQECREHEQTGGIVSWLISDEDIVQLPLVDLQDIVKSLLRKYDITERKTP